MLKITKPKVSMFLASAWQLPGNNRNEINQKKKIRLLQTPCHTLEAHMWKVPHEAEALGNRSTQPQGPSHRYPVPELSLQEFPQSPCFLHLVLQKRWKITEELGVEMATYHKCWWQTLFPWKTWFTLKKRRWAEHEQEQDTIARIAMTFMLPANSLEFVCS